MSTYIGRDTSGNRKESIFHGGGTGTVGIPVMCIMQYKTDSKESHTVQEEVVAEKYWV